MSELPVLNVETLWSILNEEIDDATVNQLVWSCLGYAYDNTSGTWDNAKVSPEWREEYPEPPDFIAYRPPTMKLTRSIPKENKQLLKQKLGFKGYKIGEFGPRQTRRATAANWLLNHMYQSGLYIDSTENISEISSKNVEKYSNVSLNKSE